MKKSGAVFLALITMPVVGIFYPAGMACAGFNREFEEFNRQQSFRPVEDLDREIQIQIDETKKEKEETEEEGGGKEKKKPAEEKEAGDDWESQIMKPESGPSSILPPIRLREKMD